MPKLVDQGTWHKLNDSKFMQQAAYYTNKDVVGKLLRYITRTRYNENRGNELIKVGGAGINCSASIFEIIRQIESIQEFYQINQRGGRRMLHEVYSFSDQEFRDLNEDYRYIDMIAREISYYFFCMGYQVVYAIHYCPQKKNHIHFAISTINFYTGKKIHTNKCEYKAWEVVFENIYMKVSYAAREQRKSDEEKRCPIGFY